MTLFILITCLEMLKSLSLQCCLQTSLAKRFLDPDIDVDWLQDVLSTSSNKGLVCDRKDRRRAEIK